MTTALSDLKVSITQVANAIGTSESTIKNLFKAGKLDNLAENIGTGTRIHLRISASSIDDIKAVVEEHTKSRKSRVSNREIDTKMTALAKAVYLTTCKSAANNQGPSVAQKVYEILTDAGFEIRQ